MYTIERFGAITLSPFNNSFPLSPVPTRLNVTQTAGGLFDNDGTGRSKQIFPFALPYSCVITESTYNNNRAVLDTLRGAVGTRARLYRRAIDDASVQYCTARLTDEPHDWPYTQRGYFEVTLNFQQLSPWAGTVHGAGWLFDTGILFDAARTLDETPPTTLNTNPKAITVNNGGNLPTSDIVFTLTAGSAPITNLILTGDLWSLMWTGSLAVGQALQIDAGAMSVLKAGASDYSALRTLSGHKIEQWAAFQPGNTSIGVTLIGGSTNST